MSVLKRKFEIAKLSKLIFNSDMNFNNKIIFFFFSFLKLNDFIQYPVGMELSQDFIKNILEKPDLPLRLNH